MKKAHHKKRQINSTGLVIACITFAVLSVIVVLSSFIVYRDQILESTSILESYDNETYDKHYVMII